MTVRISSQKHSLKLFFEMEFYDTNFWQTQNVEMILPNNHQNQKYLFLRLISDCQLVIRYLAVQGRYNTYWQLLRDDLPCAMPSPCSKMIGSLMVSTEIPKGRPPGKCTNVINPDDMVINSDEKDVVGTSNIGPGHCLVLRSFWP